MDVLKRVHHSRYCKIYERMNSWVILTQNVILIYCPFQTSTRMVIFTLQQNQSKIKKDTTFWQKVCCPTIHQIALSSLRLQPWENLWPWSHKWNNNSTFRKIKDCRQHAIVTCAKWALKVGSLLVTVRVLNV